MDRGGRFLPDHFRPCSDGLFLRLFGDIAFLPHLILDNEGARGAGVPGSRVPEGAGCRVPEVCRKYRKGAGSAGRVPEAGRVSEVAGDRQGGSSPAASQAAK